MSSVLLYTSPADALPQSYKRLLGAMTTKLVFYDKHPAYCQNWSNRVSGKCEAKREKESVLDGTVFSLGNKSLNLRVSPLAFVTFLPSRIHQFSFYACPTEHNQRNVHRMCKLSDALFNKNHKDIYLQQSHQDGSEVSTGVFFKLFSNILATIN